MDKNDFEHLKNKFEKETVSRRYAKVFGNVSLITSLATVIISVVWLISGELFPGKSESKGIEEQIERLQKDVAKQHEINKRLLERNTVAIDTSDYGRQVYDIEKKVDNLNNIILEDPEKALSIPLLKAEIKNQKERNERDIESIKNDISRVYDITKWLIGLIITMLISIVTLNISNLYSKKQKEE